MSKKSLLLGLLCSCILLFNQVKADTNVSTVINTTTDIVNQEPNEVKVEVPVTTVDLETDIPSESDKAVKPTDVVETKPEDSVETVNVTTTTTSESKVPIETTTQVTQPVTNVVSTQPTTVTTVTQSNVMYSKPVSETQSIVVETAIAQSESENNSVNFVEEKPVGTLVQLGVSDKSKPVGTLKYYTQQLPNTSSKNQKIGVIGGVVLLTGLLVHGLYYFSKRIFS